MIKKIREIQISEILLSTKYSEIYSVYSTYSVHSLLAPPPAAIRVFGVVFGHVVEIPPMFVRILSEICELSINFRGLVLGWIEVKFRNDALPSTHRKALHEIY